MRKIMLSFALLLAALGAFAQQENSVRNFGEFTREVMKQLCPDYATVTSYEIPEGYILISPNAFCECKALTSVTIGRDVKVIGSYAFAGNAKFGGCSKLASVTIPEGVEAIGDYAFYNCPAIRSISIPASVKSIGKGAFMFCSSLERITVAESNPSYRSHGGIMFDKGMTKLVCYPAQRYGPSFAIPEGIRTVKLGAFCACAQLSSLALPSTMNAISDYMLRGFSRLSNIKIPDSVTKIERGAFDSCKNLTIEFGKGISSIGGQLFSNSLESLVISGEIESLGDGAFANCSGLSRITMPSSLKSIGKGAFYGCSKLESIRIPDSVKKIGDEAFSHCSGLKSVEISSGISEIGKKAFSTCKKLSSIRINTEKVPQVHSDTFEGNAKGKGDIRGRPIIVSLRKIYVPFAALESYRKNDVWKRYAPDIEAIHN